VHQLLEGTPDEVPQRYELASPRRRLPIGVPMLLVHGVRDDDVPVHVSREFAEAAAAAGDDCGLVIVDDEGHYEHLEPGSQCWEAVVEWLAS
jgi:pimeloyl-ACP methyl ester carboxylesterase